MDEKGTLSRRDAIIAAAAVFWLTSMKDSLAQDPPVLDPAAQAAQDAAKVAAARDAAKNIGALTIFIDYLNGWPNLSEDERNNLLRNGQEDYLTVLFEGLGVTALIGDMRVASLIAHWIDFRNINAGAAILALGAIQDDFLDFPGGVAC